MVYKPKILIVDDSEMNRIILSDILEEQYDLIEAASGLQAVAKIIEYGQNLSLILLDYMMPEMDGFELLSTMSDRGWKGEIPIIMISAETGSDFINKAYDLGIEDFITRPFDARIVLHRVNNTILLHSKQRHLEHLVAQQVKEKHRQSDMLINILSHIVEFRNEESGRHILNVRRITKLLLKELRKEDPNFTISDEKIELIALASSLHDVGKISIDDKILNKPGKLTEEEFEIMKQHTVKGAEMLRRVPNYQEEELVQIAIEIARWHHERYDGNGYPDHLVGEQIPIAAQVVSLADVYDALTEERVYKKAFSPKKAIHMILNGECGAFSPKLLSCLTRLQNDLKQIDLAKDTVDMLDPKQFTEIEFERVLLNMVYEREKYSFYTKRSQEMRFEYTLHPPILTMSELAAYKLNVNPVIPDPNTNPGLIKSFGTKNIQKILAHMDQLSEQDPECEFELLVSVLGEKRWWNIILHANYNERICDGYFGLFVDIHDEKMQRSQLEHNANYDNLTGLMNKAYAEQLIQERMNKTGDGNFAFVIIDLDHFKWANDRHGHLFGDEVLRYFASLIKKNVRSSDISARIGGDEFILFFQYPKRVEPIIKCLFCSLQGQYKQYPVQISMGVATTKTCAHNFDQLFMKADELLYEAKKSGRANYKISE